MIYDGFCDEESEAVAEYPAGIEFFQEDNPFERYQDKIITLCRTNNTKVLKVLLSKPETVLTDQAFTTVLDFIARSESPEIGQQLFEKLMKKEFEASTLRPFLEKLGIKEAVTILSLAISYLFKNGDNFERHLELASAITDCHCNKLLWSRQFSAEITNNIETLKTDLCELFQSVEAKYIAGRANPRLFDPPPADYWVEKVLFEECKTFDLSKPFSTASNTTKKS